MAGTLAGRGAHVVTTEVGWIPSRLAATDLDGIIVCGPVRFGRHPGKLRRFVAVTYTRYNPVLRSVMRSISREKGLSTDTTRDHEYTDWAAVEAFARAFGDRVREAAAGRVAAG